jgi:hypothetical protein
MTATTSVPDDGEQHAQAAKQLRRDEHQPHDRAEKRRGRHLAPGLLHAGSEADREQGRADDAKPPRVRLAAGFEAGQFPARRRRAEFPGP